VNVVVDLLGLLTCCLSILELASLIATLDSDLQAFVTETVDNTTL